MKTKAKTIFHLPGLVKIVWHTFQSRKEIEDHEKLHQQFLKTLQPKNLWNVVKSK